MAVLVLLLTLLMPSDSPDPPDVAEQNVTPSTASPCQAPVRQLWETSSDMGRSWQAVFDGIYRRIQR